MPLLCTSEPVVFPFDPIFTTHLTFVTDLHLHWQKPHQFQSVLNQGPSIHCSAVQQHIMYWIWYKCSALQLWCIIVKKYLNKSHNRLSVPLTPFAPEQSFTQVPHHIHVHDRLQALEIHTPHYKSFSLPAYPTHVFRPKNHIVRFWCKPHLLLGHFSDTSHIVHSFNSCRS